MKHLRRVLFFILIALFALLPVTSQSQTSSDYTLISDGQSMTFIPRPDLGYVVQSSEQDSSTQTLQRMLSSINTVESQKIKGINKRNLTVVKNLDVSVNSASNILQSLNQGGYKAPLFSVNNQTVAIIPEIVVKLAVENAEESLQLLCKTLGLNIKEKLESSDKEYLLEVQGSNAQSVFNAVEELNKNAFIEWAFPNIASQPILAEFNPAEKVIPDDKYFTNQWHLYNSGQTNGTAGADVNATNAWKITTGDPNIVIAIMDSGVDIYHPDLINNIVPGYDFIEDDNDPSPSLIDSSDAHGTACAGLAAAQGNNKIGVSGVAWNCKIMPVRILDSYTFITDIDIATAMRWAAQNGADVLSNSWGQSYATPIIRSAIRDITIQGGIGRDGKGCVICFAAGNWEDGGPVIYPAAYSEVIAVGATDHKDNALHYSASGPELDIVAPSGPLTYQDLLDEIPYLWTTDITGIDGYSIENENPSILDYTDSMSGTSGACPIVAGTAALVLSVDPNLTNLQVRTVLLESAHDLGEPGKDDYYGYGRVDANAAVVMAFNPPEIQPDIVFYVDDNAPNDPCAYNPDFSDPNENGTLEHPFDSIQKAIDYAVSTETIIVLPGTYTGNGNYNIDLFGKSLKIHSETGPENCIIDCQELGRGFYMHNKESRETEISGFTITNGKAINAGGIYCSNSSSPEISNCIISNCKAAAWGNLGGDGGGIFIDNSASPTISDCTFTNNTSSWYGGGMSISECDPTIFNCTFNGNLSSDMGGGIYNYIGYPIFMDCNFTQNSAENEGGAIYNQEGFLYLENCVISNNKAITTAGGGIRNYYGDMEMRNCCIINNFTGGSGGGISNISYGYYYGSELYNCIFYNNTAGSEGGAIYSEESYFSIKNCTLAQNSAVQGNAIACDADSYWSYGSEIDVLNSIIWDGTDSIANLDNSYFYIDYSDVQKAGTSRWTGIGNINKNPLFADPNNNDFHLKSEGSRWNSGTQTWVQDDVTSPCIDAGAPDSVLGDEPAPNGNRINLGFYGGTLEASKSSSGGFDPNDPNAMTKAYNPNPSDNSYCYELSTILSWTAGDYAIKHDVYLGTNIGSVTNATRNNPLGVLKSKAQTTTSYNTGFLNNFMVYYWRVDEVLADNTIIKGDIWTFIVYVENN